MLSDRHGEMNRAGGWKALDSRGDDRTSREPGAHPVYRFRSEAGARLGPHSRAGMRISA